MLRSGGVCALSTWHTVGWIPYARAAFDTITDAPTFPDTETFMNSFGKGPWHNPAFVEQQLATHGFENIEVQTVPSSTTMPSPEKFAELFSGMTVQMTTRFWSDEDRNKYSGLIGPALLKVLIEKYGEGQAFELEMVAIVATCRKP